MTDEPDPAAGPDPRPVPDAPALPPQVQVAGISVGLQGIVGIAFAVVLLIGGLGAGEGLRFVLGESGYFLLIGAALVAVGIGLVRGKRWGRSPAIVAELLLIPVVYSLLGPSRQLVWGIVTGIVVVATFLLLISEPARRWSAAPYER